MAGNVHGEHNVFKNQNLRTGSSKRSRRRGSPTLLVPTEMVKPELWRITESDLEQIFNGNRTLKERVTRFTKESGSLSDEVLYDWVAFLIPYLNLELETKVVKPFFAKEVIVEEMSMDQKEGTAKMMVVPKVEEIDNPVLTGIPDVMLRFKPVEGDGDGSHRYLRMYWHEPGPDKSIVDEFHRLMTAEMWKDLNPISACQPETVTEFDRRDKSDLTGFVKYQKIAASAKTLGAFSAEAVYTDKTHVDFPQIPVSAMCETYVPSKIFANSQEFYSLSCVVFIGHNATVVDELYGKRLRAAQTYHTSPSGPPYSHGGSNSRSSVKSDSRIYDYGNGRIFDIPKGRPDQLLQRRRSFVRFEDANSSPRQQSAIYHPAPPSPYSKHSKRPGRGILKDVNTPRPSRASEADDEEPDLCRQERYGASRRQNDIGRPRGVIGSRPIHVAEGDFMPSNNQSRYRRPGLADPSELVISVRALGIQDERRQDKRERHIEHEPHQRLCDRIHLGQSGFRYVVPATNRKPLHPFQA
ncbi:uncharacterized protein B0I36DRAFT_402117 [Microdochium trichocladiopsis]|uniref:Uncharacterized protein n=1 Tax=Microdochium trichocladiopsis TaxID=1682393 RepID=A0A9P8XPJ2_9PEZI|nr:uncharacterized protein B0I36DRAFT_402117 [Microdochium trichocladiopsis]KAH7009217.1 hypothetical protein B0I36DRAFT_402117 [Microdochium trichocladiopsis]